MTHAIIVPSAICDACNDAAHQLGIDPEGLLTTLCVPLVPDGGADDATPTHYACCGRISESARAWLESNQDQFPGAMWWRWDEDKRLVASHDSSDLGAFWGWETCLEREGLKRQVIDMPSPA